MMLGKMFEFTLKTGVKIAVRFVELQAGVAT